MYAYLKARYRLRKITAAEIWEYADLGVITEHQALLICGPRPGGNDGD